MVCLLLVLGFGTQLQYFRLDASSENYYHAQDPVRLEYDGFRDLFGRDAVVLVAIRPAEGVFTFSFLETLRSQTATSSWPGVPKMGALVFRRSEV